MTAAPALPTQPQTRQTLQVTPLEARVMLAGMPKVGKSTVLAGWAPKTTLIIDTHHGTDLLDGEHFVQHVHDWAGFERVIDLIVAGGHQYKTIGIDLIDDVWKFADLHVAKKKGQVAAGLIEYGKGTAEAEGLFRQALGKLFASPYGIWFLSHTDTEENQGQTRYIPKLDKRVRTYVEGACQFILLAETLGAKRQIHTQPTAKFQAGSRVPLPAMLDMDARGLYEAINAGLKGPAKASAAETNGAAAAAPATQAEAVPA